MKDLQAIAPTMYAFLLQCFGDEETMRAFFRELVAPPPLLEDPFSPEEQREIVEWLQQGARIYLRAFAADPGFLDKTTGMPGDDAT